MDESVQAEVDTFWSIGRERANLNVAPGYFGPTALESVPPPSWSFGSSPEQADELLALVLSGAKTATASALWEYGEEEIPTEGSLGIVLDGAGHPRALLVTTGVRVVPFDEVDAEHARLEGEGDGSLEQWRADHEAFFTELADSEANAFAVDMPIVLEQFKVLYQR